jgi:hypothetical protein
MFHRHNGHDLLEKARDVMTDSRDLVQSGAGEAGAFIEAKPVLATLIGSGAGLILGLFFGRRSKPAEESPKARRSRPSTKSKRTNRS